MAGAGVGSSLPAHVSIKELPHLLRIHGGKLPSLRSADAQGLASGTRAGPAPLAAPPISTGGGDVVPEDSPPGHCGGPIAGIAAAPAAFGDAMMEPDTPCHLLSGGRPLASALAVAVGEAHVEADPSGHMEGVASAVSVHWSESLQFCPGPFILPKGAVSC